MGFLNTNSMPHLVEKLSDGDNIRISGNSKGNRVGTVVKKIIEKADDVTKAIEQEVVNDSYSFKVGTGDVDVSADVEDGFGEVGLKGVTYQNILDFNNSHPTSVVFTQDTIGQRNIPLSHKKIKPNTIYTLVFTISNLKLGALQSVELFLQGGVNNNSYNRILTINSNGTYKYKFTSATNISKLTTDLKGSGSQWELDEIKDDRSLTISNIMLLEGDHTNNPNLPSCFDEIVGVGDKSKNLFNGKLQIGGINGANGANEDNSTRLRTDFIEISNTTISTKSYEENLDVRLYFFYDSQKRFIQSNAVNTTNLYSTTAPSNTKYIRVVFANKDLNYSFSHSNYTNIQIQEGSAPTEYQPYGTHKIEILSNGKNLFNVKEFAEKEADMSKAHEEETKKLTAEKEEAEKKLEEQHAQELKELTEKYEAELKDSKEAHEAELEKMKNLYDEQLAEVQEAFREKTAGFRKEIDRYKEQIEVLMLHIDDPFVLQEIQMKQSQQPQEKETE